MGYSLVEAAKASGKSKMTIQRAIKGGKMSANRNDDGSYDIDPSELHRVFAVVHAHANDTRNDTANDIPSDASVLRLQVKIRDEKIALLEVERERERKVHETTIEDLRRRLDLEAEERRKTQSQLTALLTDQRTKGQERKRRRWWPFRGANDG